MEVEPVKKRKRFDDEENEGVNIAQIICGVIVLGIIGCLFYAVTLMNSSYKDWYGYDKMDNREWDPFSNTS